MNELLGLLIATSIIWLSGYMGAKLINQQERYVSYSKKSVRQIGILAKRGVLFLWRRIRN